MQSRHDFGNCAMEDDEMKPYRERIDATRPRKSKAAQKQRRIEHKKERRRLAREMGGGGAERR